MINVKIIDSARFLKMPVSTQALYFHLITRGDDDGIVEAFNVMRMTGATEDDLKILVAKNFVQVLNDDLVTFITDWGEHNLIRADRKVDSIYKNLLLQILPDVRLIEKKQKAEPCRSNDSEMSAECQHRLGKDSIGYVSSVKDSSVEDSIDKPKKEKVNYIDLTFIDDVIEKVKITQEQYNKLLTKYNQNLLHSQIIALDNYIVNGKGNKYKDHYRALNTWCKDKGASNGQFSRNNNQPKHGQTTGLEEGIGFSTDDL